MDDRIDELFARAESGAPSAAGELFEALYAELHRLARRELQRNGGAVSLGTTTLLHETYLSVKERSSSNFPDRGRFLAYAARAMRGLVIDYGRRQQALKRGGEFHITGIDESKDGVGADQVNAPRLEELAIALDALAALDGALVELVDLHFFCGFEFQEIATMRGVSERTVQRDWRKARMLLRHALDETRSAN